MPLGLAAAHFGGSGGAVTTEARSGTLLPMQKGDVWAALYEEMEGKLCEKDDDGEEGI